MTELSFTIKAEGSAAQKAVEQLARKMKELQAQSQAAGQTGEDAAAALQAAYGNLGTTLSRTQSQFAATGVGIRDSNNMAAGSVGNLIAQFNDIGMMAASGQNPLMTMIQQGSQVSQVIGPMGAAGAVKALGTAFMGMLSPVNLVTYAVIAGAAAIIQWLTSSGDEAKSLEEAIRDVEGAVKKLEAVGGQSLKSVKEDFGDITPEVAKLSEALGKLADTQAIIALKDAFRALKGEVEGDWLNTDTGQIADLLNVRWQKFEGNAPKIGINPVIRDFQSSLAQLQDASDITEQLAVIQSINRQFVAAAGGIGNMTVAQSEYYSKVLATESALRRIVVAQQEAARAQLEIRRAASVENDRMGGPTQYDKPVDVGLEQRVAARKEAEAARKEAAALLEELTQQADMYLLIGKYGANSAEVARARAAAEREAFVEMTKARQISQEMKDELIATYDAAAELAALDFASGIEKAMFIAEALGISLADAEAALVAMVNAAPGGGWLSGAIGDAATLGSWLWDAARAAAAARGGAVVNANPSKGPGFEGGGRSGSTAAPYVAPALTLDQVIDKYASKGGKGGSGGGGGGAADPDSFKALTDAAEKAMATLEVAVASIHEKVALGLMTTAEGTKAIASAKEQAASSIAELIPKLEKANDVAGPKAAAAVGKWRAEVKGLIVDLAMAGSDLSGKLSDNFEKGFASFLSGAKSGKAAMADFKNFILQQLAEIAAQRFTSNIISPLLDSLVGGIFGGGGGGGGGTGSMGLPMPFAKGGTPDAPLSAYANSVVDKPTRFPMADGRTGEMGEAGREAILPIADGGVLAKVGSKETRLPLERGSDGRLGVRLPEVPQATDTTRQPPQFFAKGGTPDAPLSAYANSVVDEPTRFPVADGRTPAASTKRWLPQNYDPAELMRQLWAPTLAAFERAVPRQEDRVASAAAAGGVAEGRGVAKQPVTVNVINNAQGSKTTQRERTEGGMSIIDVVIEQVEASIAGNIAQGRGPMPDALSGTYGLSRIGS